MCAIAGAFNVNDAAYLTANMLRAQQHRGQDAAGEISIHDGRLYSEKGFGLMSEVFANTTFSQVLPGRVALAHARYTTAGTAHDFSSIQPMHMEVAGQNLVLCHNGNLTNYAEMRVEVVQKGGIFRSASDTELFFHLVSNSFHRDPLDKLISAFRQARGAWSIIGVLGLENPRFFVTMDAYGFRPLCYAPYEDGWVFASETCAFDRLNISRASMIHAKPGVLLEFTSSATPEEHQIVSRKTHCRHCSFEHVYNSMPHSLVWGEEVYPRRAAMGRILARQDRENGTLPRADIVTCAPDSSRVHAMAYAAEAELRYGEALIRLHHSGRTFLQPNQRTREESVSNKLQVVESLVRDKSVVLVDDSIVRANTARRIVPMLRRHGAREIHFRVASPPVRFGCQWGIDINGELAATETNAGQLAAQLGIDSLVYLTEAGLGEALDDPKFERYCTHCFSGEMPEHANGMNALH